MRLLKTLLAGPALLVASCAANTLGAPSTFPAEPPAAVASASSGGSGAVPVRFDYRGAEAFVVDVAVAPRVCVTPCALALSPGRYRVRDVGDDALAGTIDVGPSATRVRLLPNAGAMWRGGTAMVVVGSLALIVGAIVGPVVLGMYVSHGEFVDPRGYPDELSAVILAWIGGVAGGTATVAAGAIVRNRSASPVHAEPDARIASAGSRVSALATTANGLPAAWTVPLVRLAF
jgi:hypothetical protein